MPDAGNISGSGMNCKAGYYTGSFKGDWRPGAFDLGHGITLVTANIDAQSTAAGPGLALTLEKKTENLGEFGTVFTVSNGCITGTATSSGLDSHPFVAKLTGELDCKTGEFKGNLDGVYYLFNLGELSKWAFTGDTGKNAPAVPFSAQFDPATATLINGKWDMREKQSPVTDDPGAGGEGTWDATWQSDDSPPLPKACQDFINGVDPDAGTASVSDAGT